MSIILVSFSLRNLFSVFFLLLFFELFVQSHFMDKVSHFMTNLRLQLQNSFFLNFYCCFLILVQYGRETCVNCVGNYVKQKFTSLRSKFYKLFFFRCHFMDNLGNYFTYLSPHYLNSFVFCSRLHGV